MRPRVLAPCISLPIQTLSRPTIQRVQYARYSSTSQTDSEATTTSLNPRWLTELQRRIGKCIMFGLQPEQTSEAGSILQELATDWRELIAGSEGFLTGKNRTGLHRHKVVWGEMDSMGHVNNCVYNKYAESARINWALNFANFIDPAHRHEWSQLWTPRGDGLILRSIRTDFKFPMTWPDHVTVLHKLRSKPTPDTDHFILDVLILSELHRRPAARCVEDIVVYDYKKGKKAPLRPFMVDKFRETFELQEQAKAKYGGRVLELLRRVQLLEKSSWDRADAKEDLGSAQSKP